MREYALVYRQNDDSYSVIFRDDTDPVGQWYTYPGASELPQPIAELALKGLRAG